jgi:predicted secreted hydrolase
MPGCLRIRVAAVPSVTMALSIALALSVAGACACAEDAADGASAAQALPDVQPGTALEFPRDFGSHPAFRTEWWYLTGWLTTAGGATLGFQVTFFRTRPDWNEANPSRFAPHQLLIAHCALSDPEHPGLWHDQRVRRADPQLAGAATGDTRVWIDDWRLERRVGGYRTQIAAEDFALELTLTPTQPPMLHGDRGYSQKGPASRSASEYYSEPHLQVRGAVTRTGRRSAVTGEAWLDHEWSSEYLDPQAVGWDWVGINLDDGGALMAFRMRDAGGGSWWSAATVRSPDGAVHSYAPGEVGFTPLRLWHSPRTATDYPVSFRVRIGMRELELEPLVDDQENDARASSGAVYWEGAVRAIEAQRSVGRGYLELTGYGQPLALR